MRKLSGSTQWTEGGTNIWVDKHWDLFQLKKRHLQVHKKVSNIRFYNPYIEFTLVELVFYAAVLQVL